MSKDHVIALSEQIPALSPTQFATVYNLLSLVIASMLFTSIYLLLVQRQVAPRYRNALVVSAIVCGIAAYHYFRIFDNFKDSYPPGATVNSLHELSNVAFNEGYRYVDWFLTVPLLLVETIAVLGLASLASRQLLMKLVPASALMIILGYPGELTLETGPRMFWWVAATIPFIYLIYVLFIELTRALEGKSAEVRRQLSALRLLLVVSWMVYPVAYLFPVFGGSFFEGAGGFVLKQAGYSIADILAKALFGLLIYRLARTQSAIDDPVAYGEQHNDVAIASAPPASPRAA